MNSPDKPVTAYFFSCGDYRLKIGPKTLIMGVLNLTPDSFFDGGRYLNLDAAVKQAGRMVEEGADIIDVGGESSRPGAKPLSAGEEIKRVLPFIREIGKNFPVPISIDTYKAETAKAALGEGASIINDIGGLRQDPEMAEIASRSRAGVVVMHMKGTPATMQESPQYDDLLGEIRSSLKESIEIGGNSGLPEDHFLVDPGVGFGKTFSHNMDILNNLSFFLDLKKPILVGLSRKSFLGQLSGLPPGERLEGALAASVVAILNGANILRTHDVKETRRAADVADLFKKGIK